MSLFKPTHAAPCAPTPSRVPARALRSPLAALALAIPFAASAQTIYRATERANPGQEITVVGDGLASVTQVSLRRYDASGGLGAPVSVAIKDQTASGIVAKLPAGVPFGVYSLTATDPSNGTSNATLINAPRVQWIDSSEAMPNGSLRLVGRNLKPTTAVPTVRFVDASGASLPGTVTASGDYDVTVRVPSNAVVGRTYRVLLNSNVAGAVSETAAKETFVVRAQAADPFGLGAAWGADFVPIASQVYNIKTDPRLPRRAAGNGKADDAPALQAAMDAVYWRGGGTIYLPAGSYRIDNGTTVKLPDRVVLKGDGVGRTFLDVGYRYTARSVPSDRAALEFQTGRNMGIMDLSFRNLNASPSPNNVMCGGNTAYTTNRSFLKNVEFQINNGVAPSIGRIREGAVLNCRFISTSTKAGPLMLPNARYLRFAGNTVDYRVGRTWLYMGSHNIIENNTVRIDNTYRVPGSEETGGLELSHGQDVLVTKNTVVGYGASPTKGTVDGEMIMAQAGSADFWDTGMVASVQGLRLTPVNRSWAGSWLWAFADDLDRSYVAITRGKGTGQWRRVASHDATSLTVDRPWDVAPDATSTYSVGAFIALEQTWVGNQVQNGACGMMLWNGGIDCAMGDNTLTNTGPIVVRGSSQYAPTSTAIAQQVAWDVSVRNNTIVNATNRVPAGLTVTGVITTEVAGLPSVGSLVLGVSGVDNVISGNYFHGNGQIAQNDGVELLGFQEGGLAMPSDSIWGVTLVGNQVTGSLDSFRSFNASLKGVAETLLGTDSL